MTTTTQSQKEPPWHAAFPVPRTTEPKSISPEDLLGRLQARERGGKDFLLVDLRRNDHEGGTIHSSINIPAQTLYPSLEALYALVTKAKVPLVIFYCGSSAGRGTRAAGWLADVIQDKSTSTSTSMSEQESAGDFVVESVILKGGIKGWVKGGESYTEWMDGFDEKVWKTNS
ncbi:putative arsenate reductase [Exophiala viscosa]|uniref:Arsenate reductase n=1 Tax=Exophiala viscosa TaxID=2486360 RepID=A0AAN6ICX6_9EURO|nr:putative arsenate reductase [Exophiala viscosa]